MAPPPRPLPRPRRADPPAPVAERALLPPHPGLLADLVAGRPGPAAGGWDRVEPPGTLAGLPVGDVILCHLRDVLWHPSSGVVMTRDGRIPAAPADEARAIPPPPADPHGRLPRLERAAIWASQGTRENYGHFLFDGLTGLHFMALHGLTARFPPVSAPLGGWQRALLATLGAGGANREVGAPWVAVGEVVYLSTLAHYLQRNGGLLHALVRHISPPPPAGAPPGGAVYLSRRGLTGRIMVNEAALERALAAAGVQVVRPQRLTVPDQIALMRRTGTLVGASGAALANLCFLPPGARVVEIRPMGLGETWLEIATANLGLSHRILRTGPPLTGAAVPLQARLAQLPRRITGRYAQAFRCDIPAVLAALAGP